MRKPRTHHTRDLSKYMRKSNIGKHIRLSRVHSIRTQKGMHTHIYPHTCKCLLAVFSDRVRCRAVLRACACAVRAHSAPNFVHTPLHMLKRVLRAHARREKPNNYICIFVCVYIRDSHPNKHTHHRPGVA